MLTARTSHSPDEIAARDEVGGLIRHARVDVRLGEVGGPVVFPGVRIGRVADRIGAVAQLDGPLAVERVEVRDGPDPRGPLPNSATAAMCRSAPGGSGALKPKKSKGTASTTSVTAAPSE